MFVSEASPNPLFLILFVLILILFPVILKIIRIWKGKKPPPPRTGLRLQVRFDNGSTILGVNIVNFQLQDSQQVTLTISATDAAGNVVPVPTGTVPTWTPGDVANSTLIVAADGLSAVLTAVGPLATGQQVAVSDVPDPANPGTTIGGVFTFDVIGGPATALSIAAGSPTPK